MFCSDRIKELMICSNRTKNKVDLSHLKTNLISKLFMFIQALLLFLVGLYSHTKSFDVKETQHHARLEQLDRQQFC